MEIFGVGLQELILVLLLALIVLGPNDLAKTGRSLGRFMRRIVMSPEWRTLQNASKEVRNLPTRLMREAGMEEANIAIAETKRIATDTSAAGLKEDLAHWQKDISAWTTPPPTLPTIEPPPNPADPPQSVEPPINPENSS